MPSESGEIKLLGNLRKPVDFVSADSNYNPADLQPTETTRETLLHVETDRQAQPALQVSTEGDLMRAAEELRSRKYDDELDRPDAHERAGKRLGEQTEVLLRYYQDYGQRSCHYESQRATVGHIIILGTVGLIGLIGRLEYQDWPLTVCILLMGLFGTVFTYIYDRLVRRCEQRRKQYFRKLNDLLFAGESPIELVDKSRDSWLGKAGKLVPEVVVKFWPLAIFLIALLFTIHTIYLPAGQPHELTISLK